MIPTSVHNKLQESYDISADSVRSVSGGSINQAWKISARNTEFFLKINTSAPPDFFIREAEGLTELRKAKTTLTVPKVIAAEEPAEDRPGFLLMEYIASSQSGNSFSFGAELAKLHQTKRNLYGFHSDNYIGSLPQINSDRNNWLTFFSECRIEPQLKMAIDSGKLQSSILSGWYRLKSTLPDIIPECSPSLLHGDLWGGNYLFDESGSAVLIDPAVYYGHPEMDLAFSKMFGGFSADFYRGYESVQPLDPGFEERIPIHNMYPLLVHVNLFGGHYTHQLISLLKRF
jgi:fructosamine-3-kinase